MFRTYLLLVIAGEFSLLIGIWFAYLTTEVAGFQLAYVKVFDLAAFYGAVDFKLEALLPEPNNGALFEQKGS